MITNSAIAIPPQPPAIVWTNRIANQYFSLPITYDCDYYTITIIEQNGHTNYFPYSVRGLASKRINNICSVLPAGTNIVTVSKVYSDWHKVDSTNYNVTRYSYTTVTNQVTNQTLISFDLTNWTPCPPTVYIKTTP